MKKIAEKQCEKCKTVYYGDNKKLRNYFRRYSSKNNGYGFHDKCKSCEDQEERDKEWKEGNLICHICGQYLPVEKFDLTDHYPYRDNHDYRCKECKIKQNREARNKYSDETRLYKILQERYLGAKLRAETKNIPFNITKEFLKELWDKQNGLCAISGIKMTYEMDLGRIPTNISIDQINPKEGYTQNNIQLIYMAVNQMKSDLSMEQLYEFCRAILQNKK